MQQGRISDAADVEIEVGDDDLISDENVEKITAASEDADHLKTNSEVWVTEEPVQRCN